MVGGASLRTAILVPSLLAFSAFAFLFVTTAFDFTNSRALGFLSLFLFVKRFWSQARRDRDCDYVHNLGQGQTVFWEHPLLNYILANRVVTFVLAVSLSILDVLLHKPDRYEFMGLGLLLALLIPLEHQALFS